MAHFPDSFLEALGSWQNGWGEDQARRISLAQVLIKESQTIPSEFRTVSSACFHKRFLMTGEVVPLLLRSLHDGVTSWSTDRKFAEEFKCRMRPGIRFLKAVIRQRRHLAQPGHSRFPGDRQHSLQRGCRQRSKSVLRFHIGTAAPPPLSRRVIATHPLYYRA